LRRMKANLEEAQESIRVLTLDSNKVRAKLDTTSKDLEQVRIQRDELVAAEQLQRPDIQDDSGELAELQKEHKRLMAIQQSLTNNSQQRRRRQCLLKTRQKRASTLLTRKVEEEKQKTLLQLRLEEELDCLDVMQVDCDEDGNITDDNDTAVGSTEDPRTVPNHEILQEQVSSFTAKPRGTKLKTDKCRVNLGHFEYTNVETGLVDKLPVWGGLDKAGKVYRRRTPSKDGKSSIKHSEIHHEIEFQDLTQDDIDAMIRERCANTVWR